MPPSWKAPIGPLITLLLLSSGCSTSTLLIGNMGATKNPTGKILSENTRTGDPTHSEVKASNPQTDSQGLSVSVEARPLCIARTTTREWHARSDIDEIGYSWSLIGTEALMAAGLWYLGTKMGLETNDSTI